MFESKVWFIKLETAAVFGSNGIMPEVRYLLKMGKTDKEVMRVAESSPVSVCYFYYTYIRYIYTIHEVIYEILKYKNRNIKGREF